MRFTFTHVSFPALAAAGALLIGGGTSPLQAAHVTVIDDTFDDGVIDTNTNGVGTGWNESGNNSDRLEEQNGAIEISEDPDANSFHQAQVSSDDLVGISNSPLHTRSFSWETNNYAATTTGGDFRMIGSVFAADTDRTSLDLFQSEQAGANVAFTRTEGSSSVSYSLDFVDNDNVNNDNDQQETVSGGSFTLSSGSELDVALDLSRASAGSEAVDWALDITSGATSLVSDSGTTDTTVTTTYTDDDGNTITVSPLDNLWSDLNDADGGGDSGLRATFGTQNRNNSTGTADLDTFTVQSVPTPGALPAGLALLGGMAMIRRRRKA